MNAYRWEDLAIGLKHDFVASFTDEMIHSFAAISGDVNPLHVDRNYALSCGFRAPVVFGLMTSSLYSQLIGIYLPGKYALLHGIDIDFNSPAFAGDKLMVQGEIILLSPAYRRIEVKASIRNEKGKLVSKANIRAGMHD